ncbi:hypothetical protein J4464_06830 [Candidatus Woesearchaeota archaeon]|nr:hypothetical protein [Candidatus Woesearchaeota archaeon]
MLRRGPPGGPRRIQGERLMFGPGGELCSITGNPKTSDVQGCAASLSDACIDPASTISRVYDDLEQRVFAFLRKARNTGAAIIAGAYLAFTPCHARADQALADEVVDYLLTATEQPTTAVINQYDHNDDGTIDAADVVRAMSMPAEWHTVYENEFDDGIWPDPGIVYLSGSVHGDSEANGVLNLSGLPAANDLIGIGLPYDGQVRVSCSFEGAVPTGSGGYGIALANTDQNKRVIVGVQNRATEGIQLRFQETGGPIYWTPISDVSNLQLRLIRNDQGLVTAEYNEGNTWNSVNGVSNILQFLDCVPSINCSYQGTDVYRIKSVQIEQR